MGLALGMLAAQRFDLATLLAVGTFFGEALIGGYLYLRLRWLMNEPRGKAGWG
jgi:hypothetical protein